MELYNLLDAGASVRPVEAGVAHARRRAAGALGRVGVGRARRQLAADADLAGRAQLARVGAGAEVARDALAARVGRRAGRRREVLAARDRQVGVASRTVEARNAEVARAGAGHRPVAEVPGRAQALVLRVAEGVGHRVVGARVLHVGVAPAVGGARAALAAVEEVGGVADPLAVADGALDPCVGGIGHKVIARHAHDVVGRVARARYVLAVGARAAGGG